MDSYQPTDRTKVRRLPTRGVYDKALVHAILDSAFLCHAGFVVDGQPFVIPTGFGREGETLFIHGSSASRMLRALSGGIALCVTVTHVDGIVLARAAFHHSMNYRSVVALGTATRVDDPHERLHALRCITNHISPGRWEQVRQPNEKELKATTVLSLPLQEVSAKVRTGPPIDDEEDLSFPVWVGVVPIALQRGTPIPG